MASKEQPPLRRSPRSGARSGALAQVALQGEPLRVVAGVVLRSTFYFFHDVNVANHECRVFYVG